MDFQKAQQSGIFKTKIEIGTYFGGKKEDAWVVLREPTAAEANAMMGIEGAELVKRMGKVLPDYIDDHNFVNDGEPVSAEAVGDLLLRSSGAFFYVMRRWQESLPLAKMTAGNSGK